MQLHQSQTSSRFSLIACACVHASGSATLREVKMMKRVLKTVTSYTEISPGDREMAGNSMIAAHGAESLAGMVSSG